MSKIFKKKKKQNVPPSTENYTQRESCPAVMARNQADGWVQLVLFIKGLNPKDKEDKDNIFCDIINSGESLDFETKIHDHDKKHTTIYKLNVRRLPCPVLPMPQSTWTVEKGKVIINLKKHPNYQNVDFEDLVFRNSLDQTPFSSSSGSDDDDLNQPR